ncbi:MAG: hypothetical protein FIA82_01530 [Melioribacter sp.]|nr:hypothetical protein [Melioribacter sp.]
MYSKGYIRKTGCTIAVFLFIIVAASCSSVKETTSIWSSNEIKIDGDISDWQNSLASIPDKKFAVGFKNDDKFLYVSLITDDRMKIMQMLRNGFITWFTPDGKSDKTFGVKFPLSNKDLKDEQIQNMNRENFQPDNMEKQFAQLLIRQKELEIINNDKFPLSLMYLENKEGIKAKLGYTENNFVYELQVPLKAGGNYTYQIAATPGGKVTIRFETEKIDSENIRNTMKERSSMPAGDGEIPSAQRKGSGRMQPGMRGFQKLEPINYSFDVVLQQPPK